MASDDFGYPTQGSSGGGGGSGTVTSIVAGTGLSGGTITDSGTIAINSTVATLTGSQTLTNKTITAPAISAPVLSGSATGTYTLAGTPTITAPAISAPVLSGTATGTYTLAGTPTITAPAISAPVFSGSATGTYTLAGTPTITGPAISSPVFSGSATGTYTLAGTPTITSPAISGPTFSGSLVGTFTIAGTPTLGASVTTTDNSFALGDSTHRLTSIAALAYTSGASAMTFSTTVASGTNPFVFNTVNTGTNDKFIDYQLNGTTRFSFIKGSSYDYLSVNANPFAIFNGQTDGIQWGSNVLTFLIGGGTVGNYNNNTQWVSNTSYRFKRTTVSDADKTVANTDQWIAYTTLTSGRVVTLPSASSAGTGFEVMIADEATAAAVSNLTVTRAGSDTIVNGSSTGNTTYVINTNNGNVVLQSDGTSKWYVKSRIAA